MEVEKIYKKKESWGENMLWGLSLMSIQVKKNGNFIAVIVKTHSPLVNKPRSL